MSLLPTPRGVGTRPCPVRETTPPSKKHDFEISEDPQPTRGENGEYPLKAHEIIRPAFWYGGQERWANLSAIRLYTALRVIRDTDQEPTHVERCEIWPYLVWPPFRGWCVIPLNTTESGNVFNWRSALKYGEAISTTHAETAWKNGVLGVFQPQRKLQAIFHRILIPLFFPYRDATTGSEAYMWGVVHYQRSRGTAYVHVAAEWQARMYQQLDSEWTRNFLKSLTGEDIEAFRPTGGNIDIEWLPHFTGAGWRDPGWTATSIKEASDLSWWYVVHVVADLVSRWRGDEMISRFGDRARKLAREQAAAGVKEAIRHGDKKLPPKPSTT